MGRWRTVGRRCRTVVALAVAIGTLSAGAERIARAQNPVQVDAWHAVVDAERLNIHSGRAEQFEKIATLKRGDIVLVKSVNTFGWAAIAPPRGLHGFVARQEVADGEKPGTVRAIGRVPVLYPISEDPTQCFRKSRVTEDTIMNVLAEVPTTDGTVYLKVEMPEQVDVYVLAQFLRKATAEEIAAWKKQLAEATKQAEPEAVPAKPLVEPKVAPPVVLPAQEPPANETPVDETPKRPSVVELPVEDPVVQPEPQPEQTPPPVEEPEADPTPPPVSMEATPVAAPVEEPETPAEEPAAPILPTLPNLEQLYTEMTTVPILEAEIDPLLKSYEAFAASAEKDGERRVAEIRIQLLKIRLDHQNAMRKLSAATQAATQPTVIPTVEIWRDEAGRAVFTAQGRLGSSNVFDGRRLPLLYRIHDELTGRTIAYLKVGPDSRLEVERRLNLNVGVLGETVHDPGLRIDVVNVRRIVNLEAGE